MIANVSKNNTGKLLVAVLAMAMIVAGCAVLLSNNVAAVPGDASSPYTIESEGTVSVSGIEEPMSLADALEQQADGQTWTLQPGYYNVTGMNGTNYVSKFIITANNITISGAGQGQTYIYAYANGGMQSPDLDLNQGDTVAIMGDGVTVQNMTVQGMIQYGSTFGYNKAITVYGTNATIRNIDVSQIAGITYPSEEPFANMATDLANDTYGGGIIISNGYNQGTTTGTGSNSVVIENVNIDNGRVSTNYTDDADIRLSNVTFNIEDSAAAAVWRNVDNTDGNVKITAGSVTVNISGDINDNADVSEYFAAVIGQAVSGMTVNVTAAQTGTISELNIASGVTVNTSVDISATEVNLAGRLAGAGTVSGTTLNVTPGASYNSSNVKFNTTTGGTTYDDINLSGTLRSPVQGAVDQRVIVTDDLVVKGNVTIEVAGQFIVQEGATVTLETGAKVILLNGSTATIDGDITVQAGAANAQTLQIETGATVDINGSITLAGADSFTSAGDININGTFTVGEEATAGIAGATVAADGELVVYGIVTGAVTNNGTITIDSEGNAEASQKYIDTKFSVQMGAGATVDIINLYGYFTISDSDLTYTYGGWTENAKYDNTIQVMHVAGVVITETLEIATDDDGVRYGNNTMTISGTVGGAIKYADASQGTASNITVNAGDNIVITDAVSFTGVDLVINGGKLSVSGELTIGGTVSKDNAGTEVADITIANGATLDVTGTITSTSKITNNGTLNAAHYQLDVQSPHVYTTLENALTAGAKTIDVTGTITVNADVAIPVGTTVNANGATLNIAETATLTVEAVDKSSGTLTNANGVINVYGTLVFQDLDRSRVTPENIVSDTSSESGVAASYTNIYNALENAQDGDSVEITKTTDDGTNTVLLEKDVEIKTGVTLEVPVGKTLTIGEGVTLTVNGTLFINSGVFDREAVEDEDDYGTAVVNGVLTTTGTTDAYQTWIVGAYYAYGGNNVIAPLDTAAENVNAIESSQINLWGDMEVTDISFDYTGNGSITLVVNDDLVCGNIDIGTITFQVTQSGAVTGTVSMTDGSIQFEDVSDFTLDEVAIVGTDGTTMLQATITGSPTVIQVTPASGTDEDEKGTVTIGGTVYSSASFDKYLTVNVPAGATLVTNSGSIENAVIAGTLTAAATTTITNASVTGTMNTDEAKINVTKLYAGVTIDEDKVITVGTGTAVIGNGVNVAGVAYVAPGTTVGETITNMGKVTEYYIDDVLFVTAYAASSDITAIGAIKAPAEHARFDKWMNADEGDATSQTIGAPNYTEVYADIEYNIYEIDVSACPGVTVYIDSKMWEPYNEILMSGTLYAYGSHTITVYVSPNYEGTPEIVINGQTVTGDSFILSGDTEIVVTGVTASTGSGQIVVNNGSDDMSLTDILLIVLVVLIVIMAVIVALRLMRS